MIENRGYFGLVSHKGSLYAIGGVNSNGVLSSMEKFDTNTNRWQTMSSMTTKRFVKNLIFLFKKLSIS